MATFWTMTICQGRLFSYNDTHRHRLGANWDQIPVNCPYRCHDHQTLGGDDGKYEYDDDSDVYLWQAENIFYSLQGGCSQLPERRANDSFWKPGDHHKGRRNHHKKCLHFLFITFKTNQELPQKGFFTMDRKNYT